MTDEPISIETFGLTAKQEIRWHAKPGDRWRAGTAMGVNKDGSLCLYDTPSGHVRSVQVPPAEVEVKRKGPKGGVVWVPAEQAE